MASPKSQPKIILYRGFKGAGHYVWSPFVNKLEARFRFANLPYAPDAGSPMKGPRGKIPYIEISKKDDGEDLESPSVIGDTGLIISKLVDDGVLTDFNARLSPAERAQDLAIRALLEDKLVFYQLHERWHQNYYIMRPHVLQSLPYPLQIIIGLLAYCKNMQTLHGQGTSRFSAEEISSFRREIWESINALLTTSIKKKMETDGSDTPFWILGGTEPTEADATVFGFISSALVCSAAPESKALVTSFPTVVDYAHRIHEEYFPDFEAFAR